MLQKPILIKTRLIQGLQRLQDSGLDLPLIPFNGRKQPLGDGWQHRPFSATQLIQAIENGGVSVPFRGQIRQLQPKGFGVLNGSSITIQGQSFALMAVDQDGGSAIEKIQSIGELLPVTPTFTSGRQGRCQYLFLVPEVLASKIQSRRLSTGVKGEQLEFRFRNLPSILPPSLHPKTGRYRWVDGREIDRIPIAVAPDWVLEQMKRELPKQQTKNLNLRFFGNGSISHSVDSALSYLNALNPERADDYDSWLRVGMALHTVDESLLTEWDRWSQQSSKYQSGECDKKWRSFSNAKGVKLGTLGFLAKQDGWQSPTRISGNHISLPRAAIPKLVLNRSIPAIKASVQEVTMIPNENKQDAQKTGQNVQETVKSTILMTAQLTKKVTRLLLKTLERDSSLKQQLPIEAQDNNQFEFFLDGKSAFKSQQDGHDLKVDQQNLSPDDINYISQAIESPVGESSGLDRDLSVKVNDIEVFRVKDGVVELNQFEAGLEADNFQDSPVSPQIPLTDSFPALADGVDALDIAPRQETEQLHNDLAELKQDLGNGQKSLSQVADANQLPDKSATERRQDLRNLSALATAQRLLSQFGQEQPNGSRFFDGESFQYQQQGETLTVTAKDGRGTVLEFGEGRLKGDLSEKDFEKFEQLEVALDKNSRQQSTEPEREQDVTAERG